MLDNTGANIENALIQRGKAQLDNMVKDMTSKSEIKNMEQIEDAAKEFEAVFLSEMIKPMFSGIKTDGMFGGGKSEETFRGLMIQEYGKQIAETGGVGIADHVKAALIRIQEESNK